MSNDTTNTETTDRDERLAENVEKAGEVKARRTRGPNKPKEITATQSVLLEVEAERKAQDERWGVQNHPLIGGQLPSAALSFYAQRADDWKAINDERVEAGTVGWDSIILEEVYEALGEDDVALARAEWVQIAAVAVAAVEKIDRQTAKDVA